VRHRRVRLSPKTALYKSFAVFTVRNVSYVLVFCAINSSRGYAASSADLVPYYPFSSLSFLPRHGVTGGLLTFRDDRETPRPILFSRVAIIEIRPCRRHRTKRHGEFSRGFEWLSLRPIRRR